MYRFFFNSFQSDYSCWLLNKGALNPSSQGHEKQSTLVGCWEISKKQETVAALSEELSEESAALLAVINWLFIASQEIKQWLRKGCAFNLNSQGERAREKRETLTEGAEG